jgi:HEAT repeat protein
LIDQLSDEDKDARLFAAKMLGRLKDSAARSAINGRLESEETDGKVLEALAGAYRAIASPTQVGRLIAKFKKRPVFDDAQRLASLRCRIVLGDETFAVDGTLDVLQGGEEVMKILRECLNRQLDAETSRGISAALGNFGDPQFVASADIKSLLRQFDAARDTTESVRLLKEVSRRGDQGAIPELASRLKSERDDVQVALRRSIFELGGTECLAVADLEWLLSDQDATLRTRVVGEMAKRGQEAKEPLKKHYLVEEDREIKKRIDDALAALMGFVEYWKWRAIG